MSTELKKPVFSKVAQIGPAKHCYNIYATVLEAKPAERQLRDTTVKGVEGLLADESGAAAFRFFGDQYAWIEKGKNIAVRNGLANVVEEHILLEVDKFGRVTEEKDAKVEKPNTEVNISATSYVKKAPAEGRGDREGGRGDRGDRDGNRGDRNGGRGGDRDRNQGGRDGNRGGRDRNQGNRDRNQNGEQGDQANKGKEDAKQGGDQAKQVNDQAKQGNDQAKQGEQAKQEANTQAS